MGGFSSKGLVKAAAFLLTETLSLTGIQAKASEAGSRVNELLIRPPTLDKCIQGVSVHVLQQSFKEHHVGNDELFRMSLTCLEELRLLVPFACGGNIYEVPAAAAAPYCLRWQPHHGRPRPSTGACASGPLSPRDWPGVIFTRVGAGRHWGLDPSPSTEKRRLLLNAAGWVVRAASSSIGGMPIESLILPVGLVAPAIW